MKTMRRREILIKWYCNLEDKRKLRVAITLWILLAGLFTIKTFVQGKEHSVFPIFSAASRHWWTNMPLYGDYSHNGIDIFIYSPTFAIIFTPFALLPFWLGAILWNFISITLLVWAMHILVRRVFPVCWSLNHEGIFLGLTLVGWIPSIWSAQSNALLFALVAFGVSAIINQHWWMSALFLALPVFIKVWPIALVLLLMVFWSKQLIVRFSLFAVLLAIVPFLTRHFNTVINQYRSWFAYLFSPHRRWPGFRDAWTLWEHILPPVNKHAYVILQIAMGILVLGWCLYQRRRTNSTGHFLTLTLAMWVSWQLLLGPGTEQLTYGIISPLATWALLVSYAENAIVY
jgi:hypothetical protein